MMRVAPPEEPLSLGTPARSRPRTRSPRAASSATVALPMAPTPTTMTSYPVPVIRPPEMEERRGPPDPRRSKRWRSDGGDARLDKGRLDVRPIGVPEHDQRQQEQADARVGAAREQHEHRLDQGEDGHDLDEQQAPRLEREQRAADTQPDDAHDQGQQA